MQSKEKSKETSGEQIGNFATGSRECFGLGNTYTSEADPLLFANNHQTEKYKHRKSLEQTATCMESSPISDEIWELIYSGKIIHPLRQGHMEGRYLAPNDDLSVLAIKPLTINTECDMVDGRTCKLTFVRNEQGSLKFLTNTKDAFRTEPIRLMIACAKCISQLEYELKIKKLLSSLAPEQEVQRKNEIKKKIFHFTISNCAKPRDVALILLEKNKGSPSITIALAPNVASIMEKAPIRSLL